MTRFSSRFPPHFSDLGLLELILALLALAPTSTSAQAPQQLQGIVAEAGTGRPVSSAVVTLVASGVETRSGRDGTFTFSNVPLGPVVVRVQAPGFTTVVDEVTVSLDAVVIVQMLLPRPAAVLDEILVRGSRQPETPDADAGTRTAADLVARHVPYLQGFTAPFTSARGRAFNPSVQLRGPSSLNADGEPIIVLDGIRVSGVGRAMDVLRQIPASQIKEIQFLRGPSSAHLYGSAAGVISIRTLSGKP